MLFKVFKEFFYIVFTFQGFQGCLVQFQGFQGPVDTLYQIPQHTSECGTGEYSNDVCLWWYVDIDNTFQ